VFITFINLSVYRSQFIEKQSNKIRSFTFSSLLQLQPKKGFIMSYFSTFIFIQYACICSLTRCIYSLNSFTRSKLILCVYVYTTFACFTSIYLILHVYAYIAQFVSFTRKHIHFLCFCVSQVLGV